MLTATDEITTAYHITVDGTPRCRKLLPPIAIGITCEYATQRDAETAVAALHFMGVEAEAKFGPCPGFNDLTEDDTCDR